MTHSITTPQQLAAVNLLAPEAVAEVERVAQLYPIALTSALAQLIDRSDPADPIARQFIPSPAELESAAGQTADPIGDQRHSPVKGVVHRYRDRVLLKLTLICPVYCRFCFRREMVGPGAEQVLDLTETDAALAYVAGHTEIREVILTGGDPLMLSPRRIAAVTQQLASIPHVQILRWHTRVPVVDPGRVTADMVRAMKNQKPVWLVVHVNHPRELSDAAVAATARFIDSGIPVLSQSVLLKGVNDNADTLEALMQALIAARIKPYYLHHMDRAPGTAHFRTGIAEGRALVAELRRRISGIGFPLYVLDIPGGYSKAQLAEGDAELDGRNARLRDNDGFWHDYCEP